MFFSQYNEQGYLFNKNLSGEINGGEIYRGDLVLKFGEITERGDRKPPEIVAKQAALYVVDNKIEMFITGLDKLADLDMVVEHYTKDFADNAQVLLFVHDIKKPMVVDIDSHTYLLEPLDDGMIWNEALELLCIEKSDLKGQSAEEKVVTLYEELKGYSSKGEKLSYAEALGNTVEVKASARGPI